MAQSFRQKIIRENRIYIIPSGRGILFLLLDFVLILTAATYNNNLIFILAFFIFSVFVVSMIQTHYNLKGVRLNFLSAEDAFEGDQQSLLFEIEQKRPRRKVALEIRSTSKIWKSLPHMHAQLNSRELRRPVRISLFATHRGVHQLPTFVLETFYPIGLFRAWKVFRPKDEIIVYPKPMGLRTLQPSSHEYGEEDLGLRTSPEGDFGELKNYKPGESYHQIAWKHFARTGNLYSKVHWGEEHKHYEIPWDPREGNVETYLSQMSLWIKTASEDGATFAMHLPDRSIASGAGVDHARICWRALAHYKQGAA